MPRLARLSGGRAAPSRTECVLVAVDFGAPSLAAARWVARHLLPDARLVLAHVLPVPRPPAFLTGHMRPSDEFVREVAPMAARTRDSLYRGLSDEELRQFRVTLRKIEKNALAVLESEPEEA